MVNEMWNPNWKDNWTPLVIEPKKEAPPQSWKWEWWFCRMNPPHRKILSDRRPICPVCSIPMVIG